MNNNNDSLLLFLGDIHGEFYNIKEKMNSLKLHDCTIVQCGDFGVGFQQRVRDIRDLEDLNYFLSNLNIKLFVIAGNHDRRSFFEENFKLSNLELLPDYSIRTIDDKNILFVGGAVSIDRLARVPYTSWWPDEGFVFDQIKLKKALKSFGKNIDIVVTHNAPDFCYPLSFNKLVYDYASGDKTLSWDLKTERLAITRFYNEVAKTNKIKKFYYGHYHQSKSEIINGTEFILLGINEFKVDR